MLTCIEKRRFVNHNYLFLNFLFSRRFLSTCRTPSFFCLSSLLNRLLYTDDMIPRISSVVMRCWNRRYPISSDFVRRNLDVSSRTTRWISVTEITQKRWTLSSRFFFELERLCQTRHQKSLFSHRPASFYVWNGGLVLNVVRRTSV